VVIGETSTGGEQHIEKESHAPVMGNLWQKRMRGKCLPRAQKQPRYVIPSNKLEDYNCYMRDHALICRFVGYWPSERELYRWIVQRWRPRGQVDLKLGAQGFFIAIFSNLEDKNRIFEEGPYFLNNAGLFVKYWEERYNPEKEKMLDAPVWVRLFGVPDEIWKQPIDYEHIPFRCRICHEYRHLYRQCPLKKGEESKKSQMDQQRNTERMEDPERGFQQVIRKKRQNKVGPKTQPQKQPIQTGDQNKFQPLQSEDEEYEINLEDDEDPENTPMEVAEEEKGTETNISQTRRGKTEEKSIETELESQMEVENPPENEAEEEKIMRRLLQEWKYLDSRFIPEKQKQLYKEVFQKYTEKKGEPPDKPVMMESEQGNGDKGMGSSGKNSRKRGRKTLSETIQTVGEILINSGKVIPLSEVFFPSYKKF